MSTAIKRLINRRLRSVGCGRYREPGVKDRGGWRKWDKETRVAWTNQPGGKIQEQQGATKEEEEKTSSVTEM